MTMDPVHSGTEKIDDRYQVLQELGRGGMGVVYAVLDTKHNEKRALKRLHQNSRKAIGRFFEEARTLKELNHPNVVRVLRFTDPEVGLPYLVTELMAGGNLEQLIKEAEKPQTRQTLKRQGKIIQPSGLPQLLVLELIRQCAEGLAAVHALKIAHRDLKPANLLLDRKAEEILRTGIVQLKLSDFGIAARAPGDGGDHTSEGGFVGTLDHAPPEHLAHLSQFLKATANGTRMEWDRDMDEVMRGDIFALGLIFYRLWTGERLWTPSRDCQALEALPELEKGLKRFDQQLKRSNGDEISLLLERMLSRKPADRPTAQSVAAQLSEVLTPPTDSGGAKTYEESVDLPPPLPALQRTTTRLKPVSRPRETRPGANRGWLRRRVLQTVAALTLLGGLMLLAQHEREAGDARPTELARAGQDAAPAGLPTTAVEGAPAASATAGSTGDRAAALTAEKAPEPAPEQAQKAAPEQAQKTAPEQAHEKAREAAPEASARARSAAASPSPTAANVPGDAAPLKASAARTADASPSSNTGESTERRVDDTPRLGRLPELKRQDPALPDDATFTGMKPAAAVPGRTFKARSGAGGPFLEITGLKAGSDVRNPLRGRIVGIWKSSRHADLTMDAESCIDLQVAQSYWTRTCGVTDSVRKSAILNESSLLSHVDDSRRITFRLIKVLDWTSSGRPGRMEIQNVASWGKK